MGTGRMKKFFRKGMAGALVMSLFFSMAGSHAALWTIKAQAAETKEGDAFVTYGDNSAAESTVDGDKVAFSNGHSFWGNEHKAIAVIKKDNSLWMWGSNQYGQLGDGTMTDRSEPVQIMEDVKSVAVGWNHCAALKMDGTLWIWGCNGYGQLGNGHIADSMEEAELKPVQIMEDVKSVCIGDMCSAAIKTDNSLWMWGRNACGRLGKSGQVISTPVEVMKDVESVSFGGLHSAAIKTDGSLWTWGDNSQGQLGNGTQTDRSEPVKIMNKVESVSLGTTHSAAVKTDGSLWIWGASTYGQLGDGQEIEEGTVRIITRPIQILDGVKKVTLGATSSAAVKTDNSLWMWGHVIDGIIEENGPIKDTGRMIVKPVKMLDNVDSVLLDKGYYTVYQHVSNDNHTLTCKENPGRCAAVIKKDGSLWIWGNSWFGDKYVIEDSEPVQIMLPGSISTSGSTDPDNPNPSDPDDPEFEEIFITEGAGPVIKVVDINGKPIEGATVYYRNMYRYTTSHKGIVTIDAADYLPGKDVTVAKSGYTSKTIWSFVKDKTGINTIVLPNDPPDKATFFDVLESVLFIKDNQKIDLLTEEAQINTYYKDEKFGIVCTSRENKYDSYSIYSGNRKIAENTNGSFTNLYPDDFDVNQPIYLSIQKTGEKPIKRELKLHVIYFSPPLQELSLSGSGQEINLGDEITFLKGQKVTIDLDDVPITWCAESDGKVTAGINIGALAEGAVEGTSLANKIDHLKGLTKDNISNYLRRNETINKYATKIEPEFEVVGYLESNANVNNSLYLTGKLFVAFSLQFSHQFQGSISVVPTVVEISLTGKVNADGSITLSAENGIGGNVGVGGSVEGSLYAGPGIKDVISAGAYGKLSFQLHYIIFPEDDRGVDEMYFEGQVGLKAEVIGKSVEYALFDGKVYIVGGNNGKSSDQTGMGVLSLNNYGEYESIDRGYLRADGTMESWMADNRIYTNGNVTETVLQGAAYFSTVPHVVRAGDTVMLFYLTDAGAVRDEADRSILVYSLWDETNENWSEPIAVLDNDTADFNPDFYADGSKIYAVWQDAEESLKDLSLEETAARLTLHAAVYDETQKKFTDLGKIESENGLFQQRPQIGADGNGLSVYWYENAQDNVLGLSGSNRIYQARLADQSVLTSGIQVMSVSEEETEDTEEETLETEDSAQEAPDAGESEPDEPQKVMPETEEAVSENTASAFRKFVALTEETPGQETMTQEESVSENTTPEDGDESNMPPVDPGEDEDREEENKDPVEGEVTEEEPSDGGDAEPEKPEESVSENTVPEDTVSENTISENTVQVNTYSVAEQADGPWTVTFLQEEGNCIFSADAGKMNGKAGYAFAAGTMDQSYNVEESRVIFLENGQSRSEVLGSGTAEKVEFSPVYADETLTWFEAGDIHYIDGNGSAAALFGESRIPFWSYTLVSDGTGPEVFFPVNADGKANLYRIGLENGAFLSSLQVTDQEDYIQYADGFVKDGKTILVYNKMKVNDQLEEVANSLCTGTIAHSYYDIALQSAGSMILYNEETGEDELEIAAQLYNNGTVKAENLSFSLCGPDGSTLETKTLADVTLAPGEVKDVSAVFSADSVTEEAEYTVKLSGADETNQENNSVRLALGGASLQVEAKVISVAGTRTLQAGIRNTGVTPCGGTVRVRDSETGEEYCSGVFEPIDKGKTAVVEAEIAPSAFQDKSELALEVVVEPDSETVGTVRDFVTLYVPSYEVNFVTDAGTSTVHVNYGARAVFPENPTREGKHFIGWYDAENPSAGTFYTEETPITKDLTLYACFADEERTQIPLSECSVSSIPMQYYTGGQLKPKVTVKWGSEVLQANKDYKVTYRNNKEQGQATAVITAITGKGKKYTGSIERNFSIMYPTSKVSVKAIPAVNFTGEAHMPEPVVTYQKKTLVKDRDYTVSYFNNRNAGTAGVTITGKGAFSGTKTVTFQIRGTAISGMKFDKIPDVTYNGKNTRPIVTVKTKDGKTQLMSGSDYRLVYENTVNKGTATVTVIGNGNYTGTKKLTYKVVAKPLAESMVSVEQPSMASAASAGQPAVTSLVVAPEKAEYTYTGKPIKPVLTVTDEAAGDMDLVLNKDYTVSYSKNKAVGEAQITVKGKGNYSGTVKVPFTIKPVNLAEAETEGTIDVRVNDIAYTGKALKPAVQVYETVDGKERKLSGNAYTLSYANNTEKGTGTVTVTGKEKSGYTGTVTANFRIVDKAKLLSASAIKIDAISAQIFTGSAVEPALHIVDKSDKNKEVTLEKGTHYEVIYKNNVNAGKATVTVRGIGSYAGSRNVTFKINKCAIADKNVLGAGLTVENPADMKYTGYALKPDVVIKDKGVTLVQGKDYKLSYKNNTKIGTASVTAQGIGNYSGSYKAISFQITAWDYNTLTAEIEDQIYTGKALKPQVKFYTTGENGREEILLKPNTAVKITYKDNKNAGTATAAITGKGELGKITPFTVTFEIEQADLSEAVVSRIPNQTLKGAAVKPIPKVKVGRNTLKAGRDFTVSYLRNGVKGQATVIIRGIGNYTGECRKTFIVQ